jgi:hypothetical protein
MSEGAFEHAASRRKRVLFNGNAPLPVLRALTAVTNLADVELTNK